MSDLLWCPWCEELIADNDRRAHLTPPYHVECAVRAVIGSCEHQMQICSCYGGTAEETDDGVTTRRDRARAAYALWLRRQMKWPDDVSGEGP